LLDGPMAVDPAAQSGDSPDGEQESTSSQSGVLGHGSCPYD